MQHTQLWRSERMFKLGSRLLITSVLLAMALTLSGNEAGAQQRAPVLDIPASGGSSGAIVPMGTPDSGEPDIGQTGRNRPGDGGAPGSGEQLEPSEIRAASGMVRWIVVIWALRYLGLGN
jgi:hypothetical protein